MADIKPKEVIEPKDLSWAEAQLMGDATTKSPLWLAKGAPLGQTFRVLWRYVPVRAVFVLLALAAASYFFFTTRGIWITFLLALLTALLAQPLVHFSRLHLRTRWPGVALFVLGLFMLLGLFSALIVGLVGQLSSFVGELPELIDTATALSTQFPGYLQRLALPAQLTDIISTSYQSLGGALNRLSERLLMRLQSLVTSGQVVGGVSVVVGDTVQFFAYLAMTLYLIVDLPKVQRSFRNAVPLPYQGVASDLGGKLEHAVAGYFRGQLVVALFVGVVVGIGLAILGVPLALALGFLSAVFNLVPYLGVVISIVPALLLASGISFWHVVGVLALFTVANQLETHLLSPLILGRSTRLHPVTVIMAILLGAGLFGLLGAVFAVPAAAFAKLVYEDYYLDSRLYQQG